MREEAVRLSKFNFGPEMLQTIGYIYARVGAKVRGGMGGRFTLQCSSNLCASKPCQEQGGPTLSLTVTLAPPACPPQLPLPSPFPPIPGAL